MTTSTDPQALVRQAMEIIKANPGYWYRRNWPCGTSHCLFGLIELIHESEAPIEDYSNLSAGEETYTIVRGLLGLTEDAADVWVRVSNSMGVLRVLENLFCRNLETIAVERHNAERVLIIASRPDLTPEVGAQLIELAADMGRYDLIEILALNSRAPVETLATIARTGWLHHVKLLGTNPSVIHDGDALYRMWAEIGLNSNVPLKECFNILPIDPI